MTPGISPAAPLRLEAPTPRVELTACPHCDALSTIALDEAATFRCPRCSGLIHRSIPRQLDTALACYLGAAILFLIANVFPIVTLEAEGQSIEATLAGTSAALYAEQKVVGLLVMLTTLLIPAVDLFAAVSLLWLAKSGHSSATLRLFIRLRERLRPWNMTEIFVLGVLVATVKLGNLASVIIGPGIWCLGTFMLLTASASHAYDSIEVWNEIEAPP